MVIVTKHRKEENQREREKERKSKVQLKVFHTHKNSSRRYKNVKKKNEREKNEHIFSNLLFRNGSLSRLRFSSEFGSNERENETECTRVPRNRPVEMTKIIMMIEDETETDEIVQVLFLAFFGSSVRQTVFDDCTMCNERTIPGEGDAEEDGILR